MGHGGPESGAPQGDWERLRRLPDRRLRARLTNRLRRLRGQPAIDRNRIGDGLTIGRHSFFRPVVEWHWGDSGTVRIGNFSCIAHDAVMMVGGVHPTSWVSGFPFRAQFQLPGAYEDGMPESKGDIEIGSDAYVGREARVLSGVRIADGAVVAAYSVVTKDVRPYAIVAGNPAREVKRRFTDDQVERLLRIRWWDWPDGEMMRAVPLLSADKIEEFVDRYDDHP